MDRYEEKMYYNLGPDTMKSSQNSTVSHEFEVNYEKSRIISNWAVVKWAELHAFNALLCTTNEVFL